MSLLTDIMDSHSEPVIRDAMVKAYGLIRSHDNICCSISGGADSDTMLDLCFRVDPEKKITYVFFNTGMEYNATLEHLAYLEKKYGIEIQVEKPVKSIPTSCKQYGVPFLSKHVSEKIYRLQKHGFKWEDKPFEVLLEEYPHCKSALKWWCNQNIRQDGKIGSLNIDRDKYLKEFMILNPPTFLISSKCCEYAKKNVAKHFYSDMSIDLAITGIRKAEGGVRSVSYKSCYTPSTFTFDSYRPLFWFSNSVKQLYDEIHGVEHSRCYTQYGLKRTGCVGCPYNHSFEDELKVIETFEPRLFKAVNNIFGQSYEYTRKFREYQAARVMSEKSKEEKK